jgi:hypothetical protein
MHSHFIIVPLFYAQTELGLFPKKQCSFLFVTMAKSRISYLLFKLPVNLIDSIHLIIFVSAKTRKTPASTRFPRRITSLVSSFPPHSGDDVSKDPRSQTGPMDHKESNMVPDISLFTKPWQLVPSDFLWQNHLLRISFIVYQSFP